MLLAWHGAKCSEPVVGKGLFRYQAIKSRRGVSFGRIGGPANPAGLHLIMVVCSNLGLGPAIRQRNAPIDSGVF
jgi:hypothetical protein